MWDVKSADQAATSLRAACFTLTMWDVKINRRELQIIASLVLP